MSSTLKKEIIKANGFEYLCRTAGLDNDGELVIFLHGFPESSIIWENLIVQMAEKGYRCLAPNQRGYSDGARPKGLENYTVHVLADDVVGFAEAVGCKGKFHLVGHDWGCSVGWATLNIHPDRVQSYVAMSTPYNPAFLWAMQNDEEQYKKSHYIREFQTPDAPEASLAADDYARLRGYWAGFDQKVIDDYLTIFSKLEARTAAVNWYRALFAIQNDFEYKDITAPVTFIWGNTDLALGRAGAEKTKDFMKGYYNFVELNAGHWLMQFNEEECSKIIMEHIAQFPIK
ncbi:MAG: alpha/beta hydrolase [Clostridia bacterium]|nr:alpha/beta hydrolase [Clostridia bacterium]